MSAIKTNKVSVRFNLDNILCDFSIFQFSTSDLYIPYGSLILDEAIIGLKAIAVVFEKGNCFYCIFKGKDVNTNTISKAIKHLDGGNKLCVDKIDSKEKFDSIPIHLMAQLLINTLSSPSNDLLAFNNITGSLLCLNKDLFVTNKSGEDEKVIKIPALKIRIDKELCLNLEVKTFSSLLIKKKLDLKKSLNEYPKYTISHSTQKLRRVLDDEKIEAANIFIEKQEPAKKSTINFIDFSKKDNFEASKMGFLYLLSEDINKKLGKYISFEFVEVIPDKSIRYNKRLNVDKNINVNEIVSKTNFHIVDLGDDEDSKSFSLEIRESLIDYTSKSKITIGKCLKKDCFNLIVIHNADYYTRYNIEDPYKTLKAFDISCQHITIEDFKSLSKSIINNVIKELVIKSDIKSGKIHIIDWGDYQYKSNWKFGMKYDNIFYFLEISRIGEMQFSILENNLFTSSKFTEYCDLFDNLENERKELPIDGIIISDIGEINIIQQTNFYTVPDFKTIGNIFSESSKPLSIDKNELLKVFDDFSNQFEHTELLQLRKDIEYFKSSFLDKKQILQIISHRTIRKEFNDYFYKQTGNLLHFYFKDSVTRYKLLDSNLDIKYYQDNGLGYYFVGTKGEGIQSNFPKASKIRRIIPYNSSPILFDKLLPTMNVDFVKHENITVLPFPFKYLREYVNQTHKTKIMAKLQ